MLDENDISQIKKLKKELSDYVNRIDKYNSDLEVLELQKRLELLDLQENLEVEQEYINEIEIKEYVDRKELEVEQEYINETEIKEYFNSIKQEFINIVITSTNLKKQWLSLFESLDIGLQFSLLSSLIKHRPPTRYDWCNIFIYLKKGAFLVEYFFLLFRFIFISILIMLLSSIVIKVADFFIELIGNKNLIAFYFIWLTKSFFLFFGGAFFLFYTAMGLAYSGLYTSRTNINIGYMLSFFIYTVVLLYSIKYYSISVFFYSVTICIKMTVIIVIILWFFGKFYINIFLLRNIVILHGYMLLFYTFSTFNFSWKIILLIFIMTLVFSSIFCINPQNLQRKVDNPFKDIVELLLVSKN